MVMRFLEDRKCQFTQGKEGDERRCSLLKKNSRALKQRIQGYCQPALIS